MKVKISVKKLHRMEEMWKQRCEANKRRYQREVRGWEHENQSLKKDVEILSHQLKHSRKLADSWSKDCVDEVEKCKALKQEIEDLKSDEVPMTDDDELLTEEEQQQVDIDKDMFKDRD